MSAPPPFTFQELVHERATDPETAEKVMARMGARSWTYRSFRRSSIEWAHLLLDLSPDPSEPRVAVLMRNNLEFLACYGGTAYAGARIFLLNTSLGGDVLARVIDRSGAGVLVVDDVGAAVVDAVLPRLARIDASRVLRVGEGGNLDRELERVRRALGAAMDRPPDVDGIHPGVPWMVIYTSGTTGLPKGVLSSHGKVRGIGIAASRIIGLRPDDVGYVSMPLFHSNAVWLNWIPAMQVGASIAIRDRFSASGFLRDVLEYGATYWNFVGQPVHYVLEAIAKAHGGDLERIHREVRDHPKNRMRLAVGTGASGRERRRFIDYLGLEHVYEMYGSTEGEISAWCMPGDPIDSVGEISDDAVKVVGEEGNECAPLEIDEDGRMTNYAEAVGEIVREGTVGLFQGYHDQPDASDEKVQGGVYRSGDLGAIRRLGGKRYLYFVGRTDDWIRKDGENFSAESVVDLAEAASFVDRAAAYGVPHPVSDEWVMVAIRPKEGERFDPRAFFDHCRREVEGGRDGKWFPDFVRVVDDFDWTETLKIKVRLLKRVHYHPDAVDRVYWRERDDTTFKPFSREDFDALAARFEKTGRSGLLAVGPDLSDPSRPPS